MAPHSRTLAWKIPWTEEPGGLQSMGSLRVGHDRGLHFHALEKEMAAHSRFLPGESQGWRAWWAAICGVAQSQTRLKRLSSSSNPKRIFTCESWWHSFTFLKRRFFPFFFFFFFWPHPGACWILVPQPGIKPARPASEKWNFNHWTTTGVPTFLL